MSDSAVDVAAERLLAASVNRRPCAPVRDLIGTTDVRMAYRVQQRNIDARIASGSKVIGRKIGLTAPAVQQQLGVDQPDFGVLFDDMCVVDGSEVEANRLLQPKVEAEVAFVLGRDLAEGDLDLVRVRDAVDYAVAALEIVDSRVRDWDIAITDTVADNASSGLFVLGSRRVRLNTIEPADVTMVLSVDDTPVSRGSGRACMGDPLASLAWLASTARKLGAPLRAGDAVLSGALGAMVPLRANCTVRARLSDLGGVSMRFAG